jgi:putative membrane protein
MRIIIHWILSAVAVMVAAYLIPGVIVDNFFVALVVALVLGFLNTVIKPILVILTLPITILTIGLFTVVINAALILLTSKIVHVFYVPGFWKAVLFSIILSLVGGVLHMIEPRKNHNSNN